MKRVICCLDGTWNDNIPGSILSNVGKLHQVILPADGSGVKQVAHYINGIGKAPGERFQFVKGGVGAGVEGRIRKAYETLVKDYEPGDEVYLIGFSRGAFAARSLGGFITLFGIARAGGGFDYDQAWALYRMAERKRSQASVTELRSLAHSPARIKCVGVWDTVGNLGNPLLPGGLVARRFAFHDTRLSGNIDVALHALAIDEPRGPHRPTLWTMPKGQALPAHQQVEQVWFAGSHGDVGGGHRETGLSDVALLWMAERLQSKTGLALDMHQVEHLTRPDALGPRHAVTTDWLFAWSRWLPFIRLVKQATEAIPLLRRALIGGWRSGKLRGDLEPVNESIHDSVLQRFGERVIELRDGRSRAIAYRPGNLAPALPQPLPECPAEPARQAAAQMRRVKIFTVHGTFAHDATWDDWDPADDPSKRQRAFVNRLSTLLKERGIAFDEVDHTQYNWSGGNSHDERRVAAIGLKKLIQEELIKAYERHGRDYYDKVFIVGHSHGGTVSRLAMNLWDKEDDYYDPVRTAQLDEFKLDDRCPTCLRVRNGLVGRNSVRRPDGVITFGSPFISFEKRRLGLFTARLSAWVFRILAAGPLALLLFLAYLPIFGPTGLVSGMWKATPGPIKTLLLLTWPLALYWMLASYLPRLFAPVDRLLGRSNALLTLSAALRGIKYLLLGALVAYYIAYFTGQLGRILQWLPLSDPTFLDRLAWLHLITVVFFVVVAVPGSYLMWLKREVVGLREKLPTKYDPAEDRLTRYVSYHTPGDEAGIHLRVFGTLTWWVQTFALSAASVLTFGIVLTAFIGVESALGLLQGRGLLNQLGISAVSDFPDFRDRFIALIDGLTYLPRLVWSDLLGASLPRLGSLETARAVASYVPAALVVAVLLIFVLLMPFVVVAIAFVYLVSMRLRGTGVVFGSEKPSWNLANLITVTRHANANTALRVFFISPEAWWHREIAHCYYYRSGRVIEDVANRIADWSGHAPTPAWPVGAWFAAVGRLLVVLLFVLSIFAVSVPIAAGFASFGDSLKFLGVIPFDDPGSLPDPKNADGYAARGVAYRSKGHFDRAIADHNKAIELEPGNGIRYNDRADAFVSKGNVDQAMADYTKAIELDPNIALPLNSRGRIYLDRGDIDRALADFTKAVELAWNDSDGFSNRATAYYNRGDIDQAIADLTKASELSPSNSGYLFSLGVAKYGKGYFKDAAADLGRSLEKRSYIYAMLFRYLARTRAGEPAEAELEANVGRLTDKKWPYAVAELYLGKRSPAATLDAGNGSDQRCEAQFYVGQWHVLKGNAADAAAAHKVAVDTCPKNFYEYRVPVAELKRLTR